MQLTEILTPERTFHAASGHSRKRIFEFLAASLTPDNSPASVQMVLDAFMARERLGSTALGNGIAIPHCRLDDCQACTGALLTLQEAIDFDAPDQRPVDLLFVLMVPTEANNQHLQILAALAKRFSDPDYCDRLRATADSQSLYQAAIA